MFFSTGRVAFGFVALLWHFISTLLAFAYPPTRVPTIQEKLWADLVARYAVMVGPLRLNPTSSGSGARTHRLAETLESLHVNITKGRPALQP